MIFIAAVIPAISLAAQAISGVSGDITEGSQITISGSGFGTKTQAEPLVWDTYANGTVTTNASIGTWADIGDLIANSSITRPHRTTSAYCNMNGEKWCCYDTGHPSSRWFMQYWFYLGANFNFSGVDQSSLSNVKFLRMAVPGDPPETFTMVFMNAFDVIANNEYMAAPLAGTNCNESSCWNPVVPGTNWVNELFGHSPGSYIDPWNLGRYHFQNDMAKQSWHCMQFEYVEGTVNNYDGHIKWWMDGKSLLDKAILTGYDHDIRNRHIGFYNAHNAGGSNADFSLADPYADNTLSRIEIENASAYNNCTHRDIQPPTAWNNSSATITLNQGSFNNGDTAYVFVVDSTGVVSSGYPITFDDPDNTPPVAPSGLHISFFSLHP
jgi:hypothetical protein